MPQLSPINWLFLFMLFWVVISLAMCLLWWMVIVKFNFMASGGGKMGSGLLESGTWMFYNEDSVESKNKVSEVTKII